MEAINQIAALLKFNGQKERRGIVDALDFNALWISAAYENVAGPEIESVRIGFTIEKIPIVLPDEERCVVDCIWRHYGQLNIKRARLRACMQEISRSVYCQSVNIETGKSVIEW